MHPKTTAETRTRNLNGSFAGLPVSLPSLLVLFLVMGQTRFNRRDQEHKQRRFDVELLSVIYEAEAGCRCPSVSGGRFKAYSSSRRSHADRCRENPVCIFKYSSEKICSIELLTVFSTILKWYAVLKKMPFISRSRRSLRFLNTVITATRLWTSHINPM